MSIRLLSALLGMQQQPPAPVVVEVTEDAAHRLRELVEAPEPIIIDDPIDIRERAEALRKAAGEYIGEPYAPTFHAPPRGRIVSQAKGPNRAQRRGRG